MSTPPHQKGKPVLPLDDGFLPNFGSFVQEKHKKLAKKHAEGIFTPESNTGGSGGEASSTPPTIADLIGISVPSIGAWYELSQSEQVIAKIDPEMCVNCGACYTSCNDSGYQSITFDENTHVATVVDEDCTGCTLCLSVCPINDCITMVPRGGPYNPDRAIPLGEKFDPAKWAGGQMAAK